MESTQLTCTSFIELLASDAPAPGGGGAAALTGAIGAALGNMVGSLTVGKPKYAEVQDEIQKLNSEAQALQGKLIALVAADAEVFVPLSEAYGLPKGTGAEVAHKEQVMESCLVQCALVPLEIMQVTGEALEMAERMGQIGTKIALSDIGCAALTLKAALLSADLNVRVNTKLMKNREKADELNQKADDVLSQYTVLADELYASVQAQFK